MPRLRALLLVPAALLGVATPQARGHDAVDAHRERDVVAHTPALERELSTRSRVATASDAAAAAAAVGGPAAIGSWGPVVPWPVVGVHAALLPTGRVLAYDSASDAAPENDPVQDRTRATVWDPQTGSQTPAPVLTGFNIFCSGLAHLADGRLFVAGGNRDKAYNGIEQTHLFDPSTSSWGRGRDMAAPRWYPSVTPLGNGEMLVTSGRAPVPEVRERDGGLRELSTASQSLPLYPWVDVAPDGRAFTSGPDPTMRALDATGTGRWEQLGQRDAMNRDYGSRVVYDIGKLLVTGGGPSTPTARTIDLNAATPAVAATKPMTYGRRQHNLTVLADGSVLATGGNSSGAPLVDMANGVYAAELWNPATGSWRTLDAMARTRQYHSTSLLLPDGRVLAAGGGMCGTCDQIGYLEKNAEVFSPPYLFAADGTAAARPVIEEAPAAATYGAPLEIAVSDPASARKVALVRLGAVTHSTEMEQRYVPLSFEAGETTLTAAGPADANVAPPGVYMLFVVDADGVPSVSRMIRVLADAPPSVTLTRPAGDSSVTAPATLELAATAADADGSVARVDFFDGATLFASDTVPPYAATWTTSSEGTHALRARATDDLGVSASTPAARITVRPAPVPPPPAPSPAPSPTPSSPGTLTADGPPAAGPPTTAPSAPSVAAPLSDPTPAAPRAPVVLRDLSVVGATSSTRRLRVTATAATSARVTLARRRSGRWRTLPGTRVVTLRAGTMSRPIREPWAGRRLLPGRYRITVRAGPRAVSATFAVR